MIEEMQKCPEKNWEDDQFYTNTNIRITSHSIQQKLRKNICMLTVKINRNVQNEGQNKFKTTINVEIRFSILTITRMITDKVI